MKKKIVCRTLLSSRNLGFDIACLQSLVNNSADEICLQVIEDGTITGAAKDKLLAELPAAVVIPKKERQERMRDKLKGYPNCTRFVQEQKIFSMKLFDTMLHDDEDFWYVDSDIFFLKKFRFPPFSGVPVFMQDSENSYCFHPLDYFKTGLPLYQRVNAGFNHFPANEFRLDDIEDLLENEVMQKRMRHFYSEQTLWALLCTQKQNLDFFDPLQVLMAEERLTLTTETVAVHLVSAHRHHFDALKVLAESTATQEEYTLLRTVPATKKLSKLDYAAGRFAKRAGAYFNNSKSKTKTQLVLAGS